MFEFPLLLADLVDIIKVIFPLVLLVFWVLFQVLGQKGAKPEAPPAGNPRPQQPGNGGLRDEIERFLREAKQLQEQEQSPRERELSQQGESTAETERRKKQERQRRKEEKQRELARQRAKEISGTGRRVQPEPEIVEEVMVVGPASSLSQHVSSYMDSSKFRESASHLGEQVGLADERLEAHLHQAFAQQVGSLAGQVNEVERGGAAVVHTVVSGAQLSTMLRDPAMFRHAIVLNEIFTRPEHRWE
jgi:hypothetical protein